MSTTRHPPDQRQAQLDEILRRARALVQVANMMGITLRIDTEPQPPLAMGNYRQTVEAWHKVRR
jgi:hypothetical protein